MLIDAVLVEFDGVIAHTVDARRDAMNTALADYQVVLTDDEYWEFCAGWPSGDAVRAVAALKQLSLDDTDLDLLAFRVDRSFSAHMGKGVMLVDGARSSLERFAGRARLAVVTRLRRSDVEALLSLAKLDHVFSFVVGDEDASPAKPHPAPYLAAVRRLERFRANRKGVVVALESGVAGIRSARAAGLTCVAVGAQPAHVAMEAEAYIPAITGLDLNSISSLLTAHGEPT